MRTYPGIMTANKTNDNINLSVSLSEKIEGFFIIQPDGPINTNTFPILQNEVEHIFESKPEIIVFDMRQVHYINSKGLRVIFKTIIEMGQRCGKVYLTNLQPEIKDMFEIMNGTLPQGVFECQNELENCFNAMHNSFFDYSHMKRIEARTDKIIRRGGKHF